MPRSLLMLAFEFPPLSTVGVQRALKFASYLPQHGVAPVMVTTDTASLQRWFGGALDDRPLAELPPGILIHRIPCPKPGVPPGLWARRARRLMSIEDEDIGRQWETPLLERWDRIVADVRPAALYATIPPFSIAPLAVKLARRSRLPLILDFRDSWSQWCNSPRPSWLHYQLVLRRERRCVEAACAIVATTAQMVREIQAVHPHVPRERFHVIPNGYDEPLQTPAAAQAASADPFVIGYVGSFYYLPEMRASVMEPWWRRPVRHWLHYSPRRQDWRYRSPYYFFRALAKLFERRADLRTRVKVRFAGDRESWLAEQIEEFGLGDVVEHVGRLSLSDSLDFQSRCDALLSTSAKVLGGRDPFVAGKTFEYVASGRPVVAFVAEGEQRDFWQQSGVALLCDPDDAAASAAGLERLTTGGFMANPNRSFLLRFERYGTAARLAALVEACA